MKQCRNKSTNRLVPHREPLSLTKEMLVALSRQKCRHPPVHFSDTEVGKVSGFKVLSAQISEDVLRHGVVWEFLLESTAG